MFLFLLLILFGISSNSQIINNLGVRFGVSISELVWSGINEPSMPNLRSVIPEGKIIGLYNCFEFETMNRKYYDLGFSVGYYQKGSGSKRSSGLIATKCNLDYLTFDMKFKVKYIHKQVELNLSIGPRLDYLVQNCITFYHCESEGTLNRLNTGLRYGLGVEYQFSRFLIIGGWENNFNFNKIIEDMEVGDKTMVFYTGLKIHLRNENNEQN